MGQPIRNRVAQLVLDVLRPEKLGTLPEIPPDRSRPSLLAWLTAGESLPEDAPAPANQGSFLAWLFRAETLPADPPVPAEERVSFPRTLFASEQLPLDSASGSGSTGRSREGGG